jgi:hypothetical protein
MVVSTIVSTLNMETVNGVDHVVDVCLIVNGEIAEVRVF